MTIKRSDLLIDVVPHNGIVIVAVRVKESGTWASKDELIKKRYEGYSVREAVRDFLADVNEFLSDN